LTHYSKHLEKDKDQRMHRSNALAFFLVALVAVISPISCRAETFDNGRTPIATTTGGLECEPFPVIIRSARPPMSVLVPRGGIGPKKPLTNTKTAKSSTASSNSSKQKSAIVEIPAFFRTKTALSVMGTSMLGFGVPIFTRRCSCPSSTKWAEPTSFSPPFGKLPWARRASYWRIRLRKTYGAGISRSWRSVWYPSRST
jgi:hypothetical protein